MRMCQDDRDNDAVRLLVSRDPIQPQHMAEFFEGWEQIRYGELIHTWHSDRKPARLVCMSPPINMEEARWLRALETSLPPGRKLEFLSRQEPVIIAFQEPQPFNQVWDA